MQLPSIPLVRSHVPADNLQHLLLLFGSNEDLPTNFNLNAGGSG